MRMRDFRSDTVTQPTEAMREAMRNAEVGDDVFGEDPTANRLQEIGAQRLGKEAALFVPSGVFSNQCAIGLWAGRGDEVIASERSHIVEHECGAAAALWSVQMRPVAPGPARHLRVEDIAPRIRVGDDIHIPRTALLCLENALADGTVMPVAEMRRVRDLAARHGIPVHLDGARLFNAALALGVDPREIAEQADSVTCCLSKGLGAPVGSLLLGPFDFIERARRRRKMMGGGMRQVGVLAAPAIVALETGVVRLAEDHANARLLALALERIPGARVELEAVQTNMVFCRVEKVGKTESGLVDYLGGRGFRSYPPFREGIRFVTSREVDADDVRALAAAVAEYLGS